MGLLKKLKKVIKKVDPIGSKLHEKTGGKLESKISGKTPLSRMLNGNTSRLPAKGTGGNAPAKPTSAVGNVPSKPMQISGKPTGGTSKPMRAGGFNTAAGARLNKLAGRGRNGRVK